MGGTFDPIHYGHLVTAEAARVELELDEVVFVPTGDPPHKTYAVTEAKHRYLMTVLATLTNPYFLFPGLTWTGRERLIPSTPSGICGPFTVPRWSFLHHRGRCHPWKYSTWKRSRGAAPHLCFRCSQSLLATPGQTSGSAGRTVYK